MLDPAAAHVKFIQHDNILQEVIADTVKNTELPFNGILHVSTECRFPDTVIRNSVFVSCQYLLFLKVLAFLPVEQKGICTIFYVFLHRFRRYRPAFIFQVFGNCCRGKCGIIVCSDIRNNPLQHIRITNIVSFYDIF